ncbi:hypothetical protein [Pandoraea oxalativorans]|uniref:FAD-binding domain-containing protein n=1 Tax=Pandoraea oxalativorans TaxID=573737 RepID=A0A0E3YB38_9BURK|nr:hypothetical protein [Pandoraea oxalativorans]AKC69765.1 hypothetical protein MB84_10150 [Pandoraea oxalativorans]
MIPALASSSTYAHLVATSQPAPGVSSEVGDEPLSASTTTPPPELPPFPLISTVDATPAAVQALLAKFEASKTVSGTPVAIVSGGSLSGYATSLILVKQGFNVLVVEKRGAYSRQNIVNLKQDAVFSLARLAPDRGVAGNMPTVDGIARTIRNNERQTVTEIRIERDGMALRRQLQKHCRFMEWMAPSDGLPARLPQLKRPIGGVSAYLDVHEPSSTRRIIAQHEREATISSPYLDPAFPDDQFIGSTDLNDWRLGPPERMRTETLVLTSLMDLERSLNDYCAAQPGIDIVHAEVHLQENRSADDRFIPVLKIGEESIRPNFPIDLICIAEGAHSANREVIGGAPAAVDPNESWHQSVYVQPTTGAYRPDNFDVIDVRHDPFRITVVDYVEQPRQSVALVSVCTPADARPNEAAMRAELACAQAHIVARRTTPFQVGEATRQFASGEINVKLMRAKIAGKGNAVIVGDAAACGSPAGATGASFAVSAYPEAIERLVTHPQFGGSNGVIPKALMATYNEEISRIADVAHGRQSTIMRSMGAYSPETGTNLARQIAKARFGRLE